MKTLIGFALFLLAASVQGAEFKKVEECRPGAKVTDRQNKTGTVARISNGMCEVNLDGGGKQSYLHWMLRPAGTSAVTADKLVNGVYKCYHSGGYSFIDIHIDGPNSYRDKNGKAGRYRLDAATGRIVFESGTLKDASAKLFNGPKIGLNMTGQNVYNTTCGLKKK